MGDLRVAVTGHKGFLGTRLTRALREAGLPDPLVLEDKRILFDPKALVPFAETSDAIVHLAGANRTADPELVRTNTLGTACLLDAIARSRRPRPRLVFASSFQVYRPRLKDTPVSEAEAPDPETIYGFSKLFAERLIEHYSLKHEIPALVLRISNAYGPGGRPYYNSVVATFAHLAKRDEPLPIRGSGQQKRDLVHVDDIADATILALHAPLQGFHVLNICSGELRSVNEIVAAFAVAAAPRPVNVQRLPDDAEDARVIRGDHSGAKCLLGWLPRAEFQPSIKHIYESENLRP